MTNSTEVENVAQQTYDVYAPDYDDFNHEYRYERWTKRLLEKAEEAGVRVGHLLDVGCGTGLSFLPMLERGWEVTGCDVSPEMLKLARAKVGDRATLVTADMRKLPELGRFDLIWSVDDAMNYLLSTEEFESALSGMARNLAPDGVVVFDINTLATYRTFFSTEHLREANGKSMRWTGLMAGKEIAPGLIAEARLEEDGGALAHVHRQRHFGEAEVLAAAEAAGLRFIALYGEAEGGLSPGLDEEHHTKAVYVFGAARSVG